MKRTTRTPGGDALTSFVLDLFRVNNLLLSAGDRLVAGLGLTSARWQILGAIVAAARPQPVAWLARDLGASRQNVQRIINDLNGDGLVAFETNPHHRRAQLIVLTDKGRVLYDAALRVQAPWVNGISAGIPAKDMERVHSVIRTLRKNLEEKEKARERA